MVACFASLHCATRAGEVDLIFRLVIVVSRTGGRNNSGTRKSTISERELHAPTPRPDGAHAEHACTQAAARKSVSSEALASDASGLAKASAAKGLAQRVCRCRTPETDSVGMLG